ncbi:MAG: hypothetical protein HWN81_02880 [Candidatus Lokiarchaeota archaeon]|nr:hypothetical protein [Candidatus Lokiarchaeota archaeon]
MKGLCYIVLIIGFFLFFQQNPLYAVIIIVILLVVYLLFKSRSSNSSRGILGFFKGNNSQQDSKINDLITLMMVQQLFSRQNDPDQNNVIDQKTQDKDQYIDKIKNEVLELLDEE